MTTTNHCLVYCFFWWIPDRYDIMIFQVTSVGDFVAQSTIRLAARLTEGLCEFDHGTRWLQNRTIQVLPTHTGEGTKTAPTTNMDVFSSLNGLKSSYERWLLLVKGGWFCRWKNELGTGVCGGDNCGGGDRCGVEACESKSGCPHPVKERRVLFVEWFEIVWMMTPTRQK